MGLLDGLAQGLRAAGGVLSPQVFKANEQEDLQRGAQDGQTKALLIAQLLKGIETGSVQAPQGGIFQPSPEVQAKASERKRMEGYRDAIAKLDPNATPEERAAVARPFLTPSEMTKYDELHSQNQARKEAASTRLQTIADNVLAQQGLAIMRMRQANVTADRIEAQKERFHADNMAFQKRAAAQHDATVYFNTGDERFAPTAPQAAPAPAPAQLPPAQAARVNWQVSPAEQAQRDQAANIIKTRETQPNGGGAIPTASVVEGSAPPPAQPQATGLPESARGGSYPPNVQAMLDAARSPRERADIIKKYNTIQLSHSVDLAGGRESTFLNRVLTASNQVAKDMKNVVELPIGASAGIFASRKPGTSLMTAPYEALAQKMTTQDVETYNTLATGLQRNLAAIEASGLAPSGSLTHMMDNVVFKEGNSNLTKIQKLAQTRQIVEAGIETILSNPRVAEEQKKHAREIVANIQSAIPFTVSDVLKLQVGQQADPKMTLKDVMAKAQRDQGGWSNDKERRLQELKQKLGQ